MYLNFAKEVLNDLLNKYCNSKLYLNPKAAKKSKIYLRVKKDNKLEVFESHDAIKYGDDYLSQLKEVETMGFIYLKFNVSKLEQVELNLEKIDDIYNFLELKNPIEDIINLKEYIEHLHFDNYLDNFINDISKKLNENKIPKKYFSNINELQIILVSINAMIKLEKETMERDFSVNFLNDSKLFSQYKNKIINVIRKYDENIDKDADIDDILFNYNIVKNSTYSLIKNGLVIKINNQIINLNDLQYEMSLSDKMIDSLEILECYSDKLITVENLTSFYMIQEDAIIVYLGGFHNHTKQSLLTKIYQRFPELNYYHFGDIDAGGFLIYKNLIDKTSIPFKPYRMSIEEMENNKKHLKPLTENDINRLNILLKNNSVIVFNDIIKYMLENNVKLEQEILD